jgi:excisionase family DNA binding protein
MLHHAVQDCMVGSVKTTGEVAAMAQGGPVSRSTVDREIHRKHLKATKVGHNWLVEDDDAARWAAQYRPYRRRPAPE